MYSILHGYKEITTANKLKKVINTTIQQLEKNGHSQLALKWKNRVKNIPPKMNKEAINYVLLSAAKELETKEAINYVLLSAAKELETHES